MYQRLDFFDWNGDQAYSVYEWMLSTGLLEDAEIIIEVDEVAHGFLEFRKIPSDDVEYLAAHWEEIARVEYDPALNRLDIYEICFEYSDMFEIIDPEEDDEDDE